MRKITLAIALAVLAFCLAAIGCENGTTDAVANPVIGTWRSYAIEKDVVTDKPHTDFVFLDSKNVRIDAIYWGWTGTGTYSYNETDYITDAGGFEIREGTISFKDVKLEWEGEMYTHSWTFDFVLIETNKTLDLNVINYGSTDPLNLSDRHYKL